MDDPWSSLEVVKLLIAALTPLTVAGIGMMLANRTRGLEDLRWANQMIVERRVALFSLVAPLLNQLLCFATFVGRWKELPPSEALARKRELDEIFYAHRPLFSRELFEAYQRFMHTYFEMYATVDGDALLRVPVDSQWGDRRNLPWWRDEMVQYFCVDERSGLDEVQQAYEDLQAAFRADLYVTATSSRRM